MAPHDIGRATYATLGHGGYFRAAYASQMGRFVVSEECLRTATPKLSSVLNEGTHLCDMVCFTRSTTGGDFVEGEVRVPQLVMRPYLPAARHSRIARSGLLTEQAVTPRIADLDGASTR